jgi:hypothetical protein
MAVHPSNRPAPSGPRALLAAAAAVGLVVAGLVVVAQGASAAAAQRSTTSRVCDLPVFGPGRAYHPSIRPADFSPDVTNAWFPLPVGRTYVYTGTKDGQRALDIVVPSSRTRVVGGVRARVVEDRLYLEGVLAERTSDYYAQDRCGNVWYFGEDTAELDRHGQVVDTEGSWHAGVDGAEPGVFMQAAPQVGRRFRQEWLAGQAEDTFRAVDLAARVSVPFGHFSSALRTQERTALEPGVVDAKYYVAGVGEVFEGSLSGPREVLRLVEVIR